MPIINEYKQKISEQEETIRVLRNTLELKNEELNKRDKDLIKDNKIKELKDVIREQYKYIDLLKYG